MWGNDPLKMAMRPLARLFEILSVDVAEDSSLVAHAKSPAYRREFLRRLGQNIYGRGIGTVGRVLRRGRTLVTAKEWDCLIVLDACRYDALSELWRVHGLGPGRLLPIISPGTTTLLWIKANFVNNPAKETLSDVTVVAGNPYMSRTYFDINGWEYPFQESVDVWKGGWDNEYNTVPPESVFRSTQKLGSERILVHFLQPHFPYLNHPDISGSAISAGSVSLEEVRRGYEDNLRLVLDWSSRLTAEREGTVVITSDHGELFGEYGLLWHPHKVYVPELFTVPWIELEGGIPFVPKRGFQHNLPS